MWACWSVECLALTSVVLRVVWSVDEKVAVKVVEKVAKKVAMRVGGWVEKMAAWLVVK